MALFNQNRFCAFVSAFMLSAVLAGCGVNGGLSQTPGGGGGVTPSGVNNSGGGVTPGVTPGGGPMTPVVMPPVVMPPVVPSRATLMGTSGVDTPTLDNSFNGGDSDYNYDAGGGNDMITISGSVDGNVLGGAGMDTFILSGGTVGGNLEGGAEADTFMLTGGTVTGNIDGGADNDTVTVTGGVTFGGTISGGAGTGDRFVWGAGLTTERVTVFGGTAFTLEGGPHDGTNTVPNPTGFEVFVLAGGTIESYLGGGSNDRLELLSGSVGGISMEGGNDELRVTGGVTFGGNINGGAGTEDRFVWGAGLTTNGITLLGSTTARVFGISGSNHDGNGNEVPDPTNFEVFVIDGGTVGTYVGSVDADRLELLSGMITAIISGGGNDTIIFSGGTVANNIAGSGGNDTITISGGMVGGNVLGGADNDQVTVTGGVTFGASSTIDGGADTDRFVWGAGLTTTSVNLTTTAGAFTFAGTNHGGSGNTVPNPTGFEIFVLGGGTVGAYTGSANADTLELLSGSVGGNIDGAGGNDTITLSSGTVTGNVNGGAGDDLIIISGNTRGTNPALDISAAVVLDGQGGTADEFRLVAGGVVETISYDATGTARSDTLSLQNIEIITFDGGNVTGGSAILDNDDSGVTINMNSGTITGGLSGSGNNDIINLRGGRINANVLGNGGADTINLYSTVSIGGFLSGDGFGGFGGGGGDVLRYAGAPAAPDFTFVARSGLGQDDDIRNGAGEVQGFESQVADPAITSLGAGAGLRGLTVLGFEVLELAPALNLYGALSDALMQFGAQTAQGFALADLNLATGRATQLVSKDSPFSKGRIWAHKITHSGNGKGSIGLGLTGLTARADNDYDYEMSLTQHGFDAPVATTKLGAFNLRAVSHTMTGTIETNVAEAKVSGYGAGLALLWQKHNFSAHITSLAGAYEVEAHTSPFIPQAVINEITEGSFSAINAVVSAGVADTRKLSHSLVLRTTADLVWQTLSLDDFSETGADGIIINFDKATRFTARVGAGLEAEHWFSDVVFVHETSSGGTLSSGLSQDYRQDDGTAIEMKLGGKIADLATGLTLKAHIGLRTSLINSAALDPSARFNLSWRF